MGDPRRIKKKWSKPGHPWQKERIEEERKLLYEYGLKNKTEIWKTNSLLKNYTDQAKKLIAATGKQAEKERTQLVQRLAKYGLVKHGAKLDDVLELTIKKILDRRLQTIVSKKSMAHTIKQARQFITHEHVLVKGKVLTSPAYLVKLEEEPTIAFVTTSTLSSPDHPERNLQMQVKMAGKTQAKTEAAEAEQ